MRNMDFGFGGQMLPSISHSTSRSARSRRHRACRSGCRVQGLGDGEWGFVRTQCVCTWNISGKCSKSSTCSLPNRHREVFVDEEVSLQKVGRRVTTASSRSRQQKPKTHIPNPDPEPVGIRWKTCAQSEVPSSSCAPRSCVDGFGISV